VVVVVAFVIITVIHNTYADKQEEVVPWLLAASSVAAAE